MRRSITFDDGTVVHGDTDAELVRGAEAHIRTAHPRLAGQLSREEIITMATDVQQQEAGAQGTGGYDLQGSLLEACSCRVLCPCWIGEDPDGGSCSTFNAYHVDRGTIHGIDVSGLNFVRVALIPGNVLTPASWTQVLFVDERADEKQAQAILDAFEGRLGGPLADLAGLIKETLAVERAPIRHEIRDGAGTLRIGDVLSSTMRPFTGPDGRTTTLRDSLFSTVPGSPAYVAVAETHRVDLPQHGMVWQLEHKNAIQSDWKLVHGR